MAVIPKDHKSLCKRKERDIRDAGERGDSGGHGARGDAWLSPAQGAQPLAGSPCPLKASRTHTLGACLILPPCVGALEEAPNLAVYPKIYFKTFKVFSVWNTAASQ